MVGLEVFSLEVKQNDIRLEHFLCAIGIRIQESEELYKGKVTILAVEETEDPLGRYGQSISHVVITLKSTKESKTLKLDPSTHDGLSKEGVSVRDAIYINTNSGAIKNVGHSNAYTTKFNLEADEYAPLPKIDVHKKIEVVCRDHFT